MKRLTERDEFGNADIISLSDVMPELYAELSFSETNALTEVLNRLAAYEDTGLEPEEYKKHVEALKKLDIEHMHDLLQAEYEGRLVVQTEGSS